MRKLELNEIADFCRNLSMLSASGVSNSEALNMLSETPNLEFLKDITDEIDYGTTLADALDKTGAFPSLVTGLIRVGEETGRQSESLDSIADYFESRNRINRFVKESLFYPAVLSVVMLIVIVLLLTKVLPIFSSVYQQLGTEMTGFSGVLLKFGMWLNKVLPILGIIILVCLIAAVVCWFVPTTKKKMLDLVSGNNDKGLNAIRNRAYLTRAIAMGVGSGMTLEDSVSLGADLIKDVENPSASCKEASEMISCGESAAKVFREKELIPEVECRLIDVGVKTGYLDKAMQNVAERMDESYEEAVRKNLSKIEPSMVLGTTVIIGIVLISVMIPLIHVMNAIG
ncbi:MAG: type II secretion system F family protein [Clostridia bacterium]|nr:type II secretion system F family protein [Clostridia bacterium]